MVIHMQKSIAGSLADQAYEKIKEMVLDMTPANNRLPSEEELAKSMGISRPTVREALRRLIRNGYITSSHGRGTFGHPAAINTINRIDLHTDFLELLQFGYEKVKVEVEHLGVMQSSESYCKYTGRPTEEVYSMLWKYSADGNPVLYGSFEFPVDVFSELPHPDHGVYDLKEFGKKYLYRPISYVTMTLRCKKYEPAATWLGLPADSAMLSWKEIIRNIDDSPVGFARFYVHTDNLPMSMIAQFD